MSSIPGLAKNFLNSGIHNDELSEEQSLKYNLINFVILLAAISSPIIGLLHLNQLYGYDSPVHAVNCFLFSGFQFFLLFYLRYSPGKIQLISNLFVISVFLIFTSNLFFSVNESVRILWFVIFLTVADFSDSKKFKNKATISVAVILTIFLVAPGMAVNLSSSDILTSLLILILWSLILHYYHFKLNKLQKNLKESRNRHSTIFKSLDDGIININAKGNIESVNPAIERMFGYDEKELVDKNISLLIPAIHTFQYDVFLKKNSNLYAHKKDGSVFPIEISLNEMDIHGKRIFAGVIRDISFQKKAEKEIIAAKEKAEQANHAKSDFLSRMSHELRTPLNAILGFGKLLCFHTDEIEGTAKENAKEIVDASKHLLFLINEILDLSHIESGKVKVDLEPVSINYVFQGCISLLQPQIADKQITLSDNISDKNDFVIADLNRIKQVILNLLSNAVKYNYIDGKITIESKHVTSTINQVNGHKIQANQQRLRVSVTNTGKILTEDKLNKLFLPYERLDASEEVEGLGIGLVITKNLIELMGGDIGVESVQDKGTVFWFELPVTEDEK